MTHAILTWMTPFLLYQPAFVTCINSDDVLYLLATPIQVITTLREERGRKSRMEPLPAGVAPCSIYVLCFFNFIRLFKQQVDS